ncbi:hypothetical protein RB195_006042 [Necator americanus]|uniref:Uncharacterized protein n=1 Tax=Necator americanus TaxID=51031 RepID=A0ABR1BQS3_NECAM
MKESPDSGESLVRTHACIGSGHRRSDGAAKKIKYDVIGLTETRRRHSLNAVFETGEELFLEHATVEVLVGWRPRQRVGTKSTLSNNSRPESDVCG